MDPLEEKFCLGNTANNDQTDDNVTELPIIELTNATGTSLQNLNEDCLLEIFSNDSLSLMDLCSVAETCTRFKEITQRLFTKGFEVKSRTVIHYPPSSPIGTRHTVRRGCGHNYPTRMENTFDFESQHCRHRDYCLPDVERIFKNFGQNLRKLELLKYPKSSEWLLDDSDYTLAGSEVNANGDVRSILSYFDSLDLDSVFQPLLELSLCRCDLLRHSDFNGDSLTQLHIICCSNYDAVLQRTFPSLKRFAWRHFEIGDTRKKNLLFDFIKRHGRHLETITFGDTTIGNYVINVINSSCKKLEELTIQWVEQRKSSRFSNLENLAKTLKMLELDLENENSDQYIPVFQAMKSLEAISLRRMRAEDVALVPLFTVLSQLQNLRKLHLTRCPFDRIPWSMLTRLRELHLSGKKIINSDVFPIVVKQLINLEKFECLPSPCYYPSDIKFHSLSSDVFLKIVKIVERREHVLTLKCYCNFNPTDHCQIDRKVRLISPRRDALN